MVMTARVFATLVIIVGLFDVLSTNAALSAGHIEANILMASLQQNMGVWWFVPKLLVHILLALFILWLPSRKMIRNAQVGVLLYALVITNNFYLSNWTI